MTSERTTPPRGLVVYRLGPRDVDDALELAIVTYRPSDAARVPTLTAAEREVLRGILDGRANDEIARARGTAIRTVANQVARIFKKMGVRSRVELAVRWSTE